MADEVLSQCVRCEQLKPPNKTNAHLCDECVKAENNRVSFHRRANADWTDIAKEADLQLWERQPAETDHEWHIWLCYRDAYPSKRPSYRDVALQVGSSLAAVRAVANRWSFSTRMQAWAKTCDELTLAQRKQEILDMNKQHVSMATTLNAKIKKAIDEIDPSMLSPKDINALLKTATELERKGRLDQTVDTGMSISDDENGELKKSNVKTENITDIVAILSAAGVLNNFGVKQTVTTEVVVQDDDK